MTIDHLDDGRQAVVRNGYLPERTVQTGIGDVSVQVPKVRDRSGRWPRFNSSLLPPYLKRARSIEELIPWLYLKGDVHRRLPGGPVSAAGRGGQGLSANTVSRLKSQVEDEHTRNGGHGTCPTVATSIGGQTVCTATCAWTTSLCLLVIIGVTEHGRKELVAVEDGFRESATSWDGPARPACAERGLNGARSSPPATGRWASGPLWRRPIRKPDTSVAGCTRRPMC